MVLVKVFYELWMCLKVVVRVRVESNVVKEGVRDCAVDLLLDMAEDRFTS